MNKFCIKCGSENAEEALFCFKCGNKFENSIENNTLKKNNKVEENINNFNKCSICGSTDLYKVSMLYKSNTYSSNYNTESVGMNINTSGEIGIGKNIGFINGQTKNLLSEKLAPPQHPRDTTEKPVGVGFISFLIGFFIYFISSFIGFSSENAAFAVTIILTGTISGILLAIKFYKIQYEYWENSLDIATYDKQMEEYEKKWICLRCGNIFIKEESFFD